MKLELMVEHIQNTLFFKGTDIKVGDVLIALIGVENISDVLIQYPQLTKEHINCALGYAAAAVLDPPEGEA